MILSILNSVTFTFRKLSIVILIATCASVNPKTVIRLNLKNRYPFISQKKGGVLGLSRPSLCHNRTVDLLLLLCRVLRYRIPHIYIFYPVGPFVITSLLFGFHWFATALKLSFAAFGNNEFVAAFFTGIFFPDIVCHF